MLSIKKIQEMRANKKRKGFSFMEILVALIMIVSLSVGAFFTYSDAQQTRKMAQMHNDMDALVTGCLVHEALHMQSTLPATLEVLAAEETIASTDAVDGVAHGRLVTSIKLNDSRTQFLDPWGNAYEYSATARTITCQPVDTNGSDSSMEEVVRRF